MVQSGWGDQDSGPALRMVQFSGTRQQRGIARRFCVFSVCIHYRVKGLQLGYTIVAPACDCGKTAWPLWNRWANRQWGGGAEDGADQVYTHHWAHTPYNDRSLQAKKPRNPPTANVCKERSESMRQAAKRVGCYVLAQTDKLQNKTSHLAILRTKLLHRLSGEIGGESERHIHIQMEAKDLDKMAL